MQKKILFISWTSKNQRPYYDPSVRYRCFNFAQELNRRGHSTTVISQINFEKNIEQFFNFDCYVFHRPYLTENLANFLLTQKNNKTIIADHDDFIFNARYSDLTPMVRVRGGNPTQTRDFISRNAEALKLFDNYSCSTEPLKHHLKQINPNGRIAVLNNTVDPGFIGLSRVARQKNPFADRQFSLGYFSGTATHDKDLAMIAPVIRGHLTEYGGKLLLVGPIKLPELLLDLESQIQAQPLVSFHELANTMAKCKMVLAPLENTLFTQSKSGLKFFEAALSGCNVAATPIPDIARFDSPLLHKCTTIDDWQQALNSPNSLNPELRERSAQNIEALVCTSIQIDTWLKTFTS